MERAIGLLLGLLIAVCVVFFITFMIAAAHASDENESDRRRRDGW